MHPSFDGICKHTEDDFIYSYFKNSFSGYSIELSYNQFCVSMDTSKKLSTIVDVYIDKKYQLDFLIPIGWNSFTLEKFENQIKQIIKLQTFC
jgi:hypothetical protein